MPAITPNIWNFSFQNLLALTAAYAVYEPLTYYLYPKVLSSSTIQEYYNPQKVPFPIVVSGDYLYSVLLFLVAQQVIGLVFGYSAPLNIVEWLFRFLTFCGIQWTGDFSWYILVNSLKPSTKYIDFFQRYSKQVGAGALLGDSAYGLGWFTLMQLFASYVPTWLQVFAVIAFIFGTIVVSY